MTERVILEQQHKPTRTRLFLASMPEKHLQHLIKLAQDPLLVDLMGWSPFFQEHEIPQFIEAISCYALPYSEKSEPIVLGVYLSLDDLPIGYAVLKGINSQLKTAEVGIAVLEEKYRTKGYGRLGLQRIVDYAFDELGLKIVAAAILASNQHSINMCNKTGFKLKQVLAKSWEMPDGELADMFWMERHSSLSSTTDRFE